jgi:hypothetical protein
MLGVSIWNEHSAYYSDSPKKKSEVIWPNLPSYFNREGN